MSLGAGVGYFVVGGLLPTLDLGFAFGSSPTVFMVKPGIDWFLPVPGGVVPFVGGYYAHWFVSGGYLPQDAWGARGGFSFASVGPATFLLGIAYERVFTNCTGTSAPTGCRRWRPGSRCSRRGGRPPHCDPVRPVDIAPARWFDHGARSASPGAAWKDASSTGSSTSSPRSSRSSSTTTSRSCSPGAACRPSSGSG